MRNGEFSPRYATVLLAVLLACKAFLSHTLVLPGDAANLAPDVLVTSTHYYSENYAAVHEPRSHYHAPPKARAFPHRGLPGTAQGPLRGLRRSGGRPARTGTRTRGIHFGHDHRT